MGLEPYQVANLAGLSHETYRQIEHRGQLPDEHLSSLAKALQVTEQELKAEKIATIVESMFGISKNETHGFIAKAAKNR